MAVLNQLEETPNQIEETPNQIEAVIDGSSKAKACHQCRQKRTDLFGSCVTQKKHGTCPLKFCTKCLKNRYGEDSEEVALKIDWVCPKCREECNCSNCRKKRGQKPTGILVHTAKNSGCSSVSEFLKTDGSEKYFYKKKAKTESVVVAAPPELESVVVASPLELDQENAVEDKPVSIKRSKKTKPEELKDINNGCSNENAAVEKSSPKKIKISDSVHEKTAAKDVKENNKAGKIRRTKPALKRQEEDQVEVKLPQGNSSITVAGIDLPPEDVGNVFQFLEFCSAFGEALELRKGQAECVIRELFSGRSRTRQQYSTLTQMILRLLTVLLESRGETSVDLSATDATWFTELGECLSTSEVKLEDFPPEIFEKGISHYENLNSSKKLKLLNFLCDEMLGMSLIKSCIDKQNLESVTRKKEAKEKINAAKEKEKQLKQKLQDELAKAVTEKNGIPLTITERDAIVSPINAEAKEVHSEMKKAMEMLPKKSQGSDNTVRTSPVEVDDNGLIFWRFKSYNDGQNILLQDLGSRSEVSPQGKWFSFSSEQTPEVEKYISNIRMKRRRAKTIISS
ncbi:hypothetical protein V5N11_024521 [Cardamine amara subsp. amara]|uniref:DDT domain-containing protein n=1 Tax=Cardamine amara subsp. amara TaxID=228776 RepID=A0ABD1C0M7_CARAN